MEWKINIHKKARKFLESLEESRKITLLNKLEKLRRSLEVGIIPFRELDIRKLKGNGLDLSE